MLAVGISNACHLQAFGLLLSMWPALIVAPPVDTMLVPKERLEFDVINVTASAQRAKRHSDFDQALQEKHADALWTKKQQLGGPAALRSPALRPSVSSSFLCTDEQNVRAMKADDLGINAKDLCIMGVNKFGWACFLTGVCMIVLLLCIPLILALSRRRPPGTSVFSCCGSKPAFQFRPPPSNFPQRTNTALAPSHALLSQLPDRRPLPQVDATTFKDEAAAAEI